MADQGFANRFNFADTVAAAKRLPLNPDGAPGDLSEFPAKFSPLPVPEEREVAKPQMFEGDIAVDVGTRIFSEVYVLWKPWEKCKRCLKAIDGENIILPEESDYTCPHTHRATYKEKVDFCLKGNGVITQREFFNLPNGTRCVHIEWLEQDPEAVERQKRKEEKRKQNSLAPTFGTGDLGK
jgi:hypothetical protein